jgi:hypothetical protein
VPTVVLLGSQRFTPTLGEAVAAAGVAGRLASVTAGWQEREGEDLELHEHLGERTVNLMLYARGEDVFERDPELAAAHRERQERLRELQAIYRLRLAHAQAALRELLTELVDGGALESVTRRGRRRIGDPLLAAEVRAAREEIRALDRRHLERTNALHDAFEAQWRPRDRPVLARHAAAVERLLERADGLLIAGGHVAILANRLRLFGLGERIGERAVFAWAAGAMAATERIVLFHHSPPQGYGNTELLEAGLGLAPGVVAFPHPRRRLDLGDRRRVEALARRFAPADCLALEDGGWVIFESGAGRSRRRIGPGVSRFDAAGDVEPVEAA